jgi:hypothetical protein
MRHVVVPARTTAARAIRMRAAATSNDCTGPLATKMPPSCSNVTGGRTIRCGDVLDRADRADRAVAREQLLDVARTGCRPLITAASKPPATRPASFGVNTAKSLVDAPLRVERIHEQAPYDASPMIRRRRSRPSGRAGDAAEQADVRR